MTGPDHYAEAVRLLAFAPTDGTAPQIEAQVHAILALVAVTAEGIFDPAGRPLLGRSDASDAWERVL
jgi:hypothetical protein